MDFHAHDFQLLKQQVLMVSGIRQMLPGDCRELSELIFAKTRLFLSETTLKRVYGFAMARFSPSLYTRNALARFCDHQDWQDYLSKACTGQPGKRIAGQGAAVPDWPQARVNAGRITQIAIAALRCRAGSPCCKEAPYNGLLQEYLAGFDRSGCMAMLICAQAGQDKVITLCRHLEEKLSDPADNNIYLLLSSTLLGSMLTRGLDLHAGLQLALGFEQPDTKQVLLQNQTGHCLYLILTPSDALLSMLQMEKLTRQLNTLCQQHRQDSQLRIVLLAAPEAWQKYRHTLQEGQITWFTDGRMY